MQIAKDELTKYKWQCVEVPATYWPNPRSLPDERTFMVAIGADITLPKRVWWKAVADNNLTAYHPKFKQLELVDG